MFLIPAYGRQHDTKRAAMTYFKQGWDFKIAGGPYMSCRDLDLIDEPIFICYGHAHRQVAELNVSVFKFLNPEYKTQTPPSKGPL